MAESYTPFDPHEYDLRRAVLSTQRNDHNVDITSSIVELVIFEHIERPYLTGSVTYTDTGRSIEIMDYQGTEILDVEFALHTSAPKVIKRFVVREVESIVPTTDTTDMVTLKLLDYDAYLNTLINVNKMYEGKPSEIINTILRDSFDSGKKVLRAGDANQFSGFIDIAMNINPEDKMIKNGRIEKWVLREAFKDYLPESVLWRQKEQFSDGVGYSWIDSLKDLVSKEVSDHNLENASKIFPINTPRNKEEYYYRSIFTNHFSSDAAAMSVPSVPSVACSTPQALEWDEAFKNMNDPSGRSISNIHNKSYE